MKNNILNFKLKLGKYSNAKGLNVLGTYKNGNHFTGILSDGTRIRETIDPKDNHFEYIFPENLDLKITNMCPIGCKYCHESSTPKGVHGDIMNLKFVDTLIPGTEISIGGGSALSHPDLIPFLEKLKSKGIIANLTVNQKELQMPKLAEVMKEVLHKNLVHGVGVSLTDNKTFNKIVDGIFGDYQNVVVHTIAGIFTEKDLDCIKGRKMLILGYKDLHGRRAGDYYSSEKDEIQKNIDWMRTHIKGIKDITKLMSFDCLGIEQINPKKELNISEDDWNLLYQGGDYNLTETSTLYVDATTMTVARASTHPINDRPHFSDESISELFNMSKQCLM